MRGVLAVLIVAALTVPAFAQTSVGRGGFGNHGGGGQKPTEPPKHKVDEKDYKAALSRMPEGKYDPWRSVRGGQPAGAPAPAPSAPAR